MERKIRSLLKDVNHVFFSGDEGTPQ